MKLKINNMNGKFFTFIKPYLAYIDNGDIFKKPFNWFYLFIAILNLLIPLLLLLGIFSNGVLDATIGDIFMVAVVAFAGWISFQLWYDRRSKIPSFSSEGSDFPATTLFSHFIQTLGEWMGIWIGIVGFISSLAVILFGGGSIADEFGIPLTRYGWISVFVMPLFAFFIVLFSRFLAEQIRAIVTIANNTQKKEGKPNVEIKESLKEVDMNNHEE